MLHEISLGELSAVVDEHGGQLCSVMISGTECLWVNTNSHGKEAATTLFPFFGHHAEQASRFFGTRLKMRTDGLIKDCDFAVEEKGQEYLSLILRSNLDTKKLYPFDFLCRIMYRIIGTRLAITCEIENHSEKDMFFSVGTAFYIKLPYEEGLDISDYDIDFLYESKPVRIEVSDDGYIIGKSHHKLLFGHKIRLDGSFPEKEGILLEGLPPRIAIMSRKGEKTIRLRCQEMKYAKFSCGKTPGDEHVGIMLSTTLPAYKGKVDITTLPDIIKLPKNEVYMNECSIIIE